MPFINEFIPADDVDNFDLKAIDDKVFVGRTRARDWVIDRERSIYLRNIAIGGGAEPELRNQTKWSFFWRNELLTLRLDMLDAGGEAGGEGWSLWRLMLVNGSYGLPEQLKCRSDEFLTDLRDALTAHKGATGAYSCEWSNYRAEIEIDEGCVL